MDGVAAVTLAVVVVLVLFALLWLGWRGRLRRQGGYAQLPEVPADLSAPRLEVSGQYVVSTSAGDWLDRIAVHSLGVKSNADLSVYSEGVLIRRTGAADVFIPAASVTGVRLESGMAGKFVEKEGLVVISWLLGEAAVDTAFRTREAGQKTPLAELVRTLVPAERNFEIKDTQ